MRSGSVIDFPTAHRMGDSRAWRRFLRRSAPAGASIPPFAGQRVHNVFHHLQDGSLPVEQWNEEADLAAIIHLLGRHLAEVATQQYFSAARRFDDDNRRLGLPTRAITMREVASMVQWVCAQKALMPETTSDARVFVALLERLRGQADGSYPPNAA